MNRKSDTTAEGRPVWLSGLVMGHSLGDESPVAENHVRRAGPSMLSGIPARPPVMPGDVPGRSRSLPVRHPR
ncbi:hypothetical protein SAMN04487820_105320 [Actinopolyspora mzabensis]|uniref:Uncharacterized protein n=1 Tax=Actinopolyspora mzabensis TaxID=995066 RepID=A0A1G9A4Z1_ACTMZ|nr:hypothetical protein SAMN04487820_105320 [Actinopolyspora mzabensis]